MFSLNKNSGSTPFKRLKEAANLHNSKREEFRAYTREYLQSDSWKIRNVGVKIIGILRFKEMIPELIKMLSDRTPDKFINRLLGGDFFHVGFIRRNCVHSLVELKESNKTVSEAIYKALEDPYWEVIVEAIKAVPVLISEEDVKDIEKKLIELLDYTKFEVVVYSIESLGLISKDKEIIEHFRKLYYHPNQKIREMLIKTLHRLFERGIIDCEKKLTEELDQIFLSITDY